MAWRVEISRNAERQIAKLDRQIQGRIVRFLRQRVLGGPDPRARGKALQGEKQSLWRYRMGDYRLICDLGDQTETVIVLAIGHRKDVYR